jgi:hypothetical protein
MNRFASALAILTVALTSPAYREEPVGNEVIESQSISGREIINTYAALCSDETIDKPIPVAWHGHTVETDVGPKIKLNVNETFQEKFRDAQDPCQFFTQLKQSASWFSTIFPGVEAEGFINENKTGEYVMLGIGFVAVVGAIAGAFLTRGKGAPLVVAAGFVLIQALARLQAQDNFEKTLNSDFKVTCDANLASLSSDDRKLVIQKLPLKVELFDIKTGKLVLSDSTSAYATLSRQFAIKLSQQCGSSLDAAKINLRLAADRTTTLYRLQDFTPAKP